MRSATVIIVAAALALLPRPSHAQRAKSPADATVFVRLIGSVHVEYEDLNGKQVMDVDHVEIGSGSGFVISPQGYVLTNEHVVRSGDEIKASRGLQRATLTMRVQSIEACFGAEAAAAQGMTSRCLPATVSAADATRDLAVLYVGGSNFPYVALGDSDVIGPGLAVDALGFPFGRDVEVGKVATVRDIVPDVSTTTGTVSALRTNDAGERQYLQITNSVNPGNSGGPIITRDGFAVGVLRSKLTNADGIGFAIAINAVKDFLESRGLDQLLPVRRLRLGHLQTFDAKGVALRLPEGFTDVSPFPSHIENDAQSGDIALRIDRVLTAWTARRIEDTLLGSRTFETLELTAREVPKTTKPDDTWPLLGGAVTASGAAGGEMRVDYAIRDLDSEKLVARYVGSSESMAFNESVLRESLISLQGRRFAPQQLTPENLSWSPPGGTADGSVPLPVGWVVIPGVPSTCRGLPPPSATLAASPAQDASITLRAAVWPAGDVAPVTAASECSPRRAGLGEASYARSATWLGVPYVIEGVFARAGSRLVQLEVLATEQHSAAARTLLTAWLARIPQ
jgi:S1-C subfamily serine protease